VGIGCVRSDQVDEEGRAKISEIEAVLEEEVDEGWVGRKDRRFAGWGVDISPTS
jgi:hypothetical protein